MLDGTWLDRASAVLSGFDPAIVAASIGALQLDPANAGRLYGLEAAAAVAAGLEPRDGGRVPTAAVLRDLFDGSGAALGSAFEDEDPLENAFVDEIVFDGRAYRYFPGLDEEASFVLRHLCASVLTLAEDPAATAFAPTARRLCHAGLAISNTACVRARLHRGLAPSGEIADPIQVPEDQALDEAVLAVRFALAEADALVGAVGASMADLARLVGDQGPAFPTAYWPTGAPALVLPFLRAGDELVVVGPHAVAARLRHAVVTLADESRVITRLAEVFRAGVLGSVSRSLGFLGMEQVRDYGKVRLGTTIGVSGIFGFDADKVAHVLVIPDDLTPYDREDPLGTWALPGVGAAIERHLVAVEQASFHSQPWLREMLHLVVVQGVGRFFEIRHARSRLSRRSKRLVLSAADLDTIALLEAGSMLRLWQFATADERLHATSAVSMFSLLDEYELWRSKEYGFYFGDGTPQVMSRFFPVGPGR